MHLENEAKLLWIDDHIEDLASYVRALEDVGFQVNQAASLQEAVDYAGNHEYDVVLVDIRMGPPDGIEILRRLKPMQAKAAFGVLSSYLYLQRYRQQLAGLDFPVQHIDKDMPNVEAEDFAERFLEPITELAERGVTFTLKDQEKKLETLEEVNPFDVELSEFMRLSTLEKDVLVDEARRLAAATIDEQFSEGKVWVLLCGNSTIVRASAERMEDVLSEDKVMKFAVAQQRAPYTFYRRIEVEEGWCDCPAKTQLSDYPTVTLVIEDEELVVHFDTGAPMTFFSYEELVRLRAIRSTTVFSYLDRGGVPFRGVSLEVHALLKCQKRKTMKDVILRGLAVRNWGESPFSRLCDEECAMRGVDVGAEQRLCWFRVGLVGRNLLVENQITLVLDGRDRLTCLGRLN